MPILTIASVQETEYLYVEGHLDVLGSAAVDYSNGKRLPMGVLVSTAGAGACDHKAALSSVQAPSSQKKRFNSMEEYEVYSDYDEDFDDGNGDREIIHDEESRSQSLHSKITVDQSISLGRDGLGHVGLLLSSHNGSVSLMKFLMDVALRW